MQTVPRILRRRRLLYYSLHFSRSAKYLSLAGGSTHNDRWVLARNLLFIRLRLNHGCPSSSKRNY